MSVSSAANIGKAVSTAGTSIYCATNRPNTLVTNNSKALLIVHTTLMFYVLT